MFRSFPALRFESPADEQLFVSMTQPGRLRHFIVSGWISLVIYNGFLVVDWMVGPEVFEAGLRARLGLLTSIGLFVLALGTVFRGLASSISACFTQGVVVVSGVLAALSVAAVLLSPGMAGSPWQVFYHAGFVPMIVYGTVVQRLRFRAACVLTAAILLIHWASMALTQPTDRAPVVPMLLFVVTIAVYTLLMNFRLEHEERQRHLQQQRARALNEKLDHKRQQLERASCQDAMTGVANRRGLDGYMQAHWAGAAGQPFSLLLIDVDHFKAYNDHYGHPAGDECLRCVASALGAALGAAPGLVARWGGEEFVVALPGADAWQAADIARRLRLAVQSLGVRHERSSSATAVTISVGSSTRSSHDGDEDWRASLLAPADAALYQAKRLGRNRVQAG